MQEKEYYVYIMTNKRNNVLYTGVTNNLLRRVHEHKNQMGGSFTSTYNVHKLVYFESYNDVHEALAREKQIKAGSRNKKIQLIEKENRAWSDLSSEWL